jgi:hypothetical protein
MNTLALTRTIPAGDLHGSRTSLALPDGLHFNEWQRIGEQLEQQQSASQWWIADWAAYGERRYRRDYGEALERIYARGTLWNLASVSRRVEPSRRREDLSFSHHVEIASLDPEWQTVWLDDAQTHGWSRDELRAKIAEWRGRGHPRAPALTIRAVDELHDLCLRAAEHLGLDPADWARQTLEKAARRVLSR